MAILNLALPVSGATLDSGLELQRGSSEISLVYSLSSDIVPTMTSNTSPSPYVASASSEYPGRQAYKAFDDNYTDLYHWNSVGGGIPAWLKIDLGSGNETMVAVYKITSQNRANEGDRAPRDWTFQGSNDDVNWDILHTVTGETGWGQNETRTFTVDTVGTYRYYKLNITANNGDQYVTIQELELFEPVYPTSSPIAILPEVDSSSPSTVWDMSTIANRENLDSETGSIKYQYSCHNTSGSPSWNGTWLTLAQLQAESDPTGQYFQLKAQFISDGTQDASLAEMYINADVSTGSTATKIINILE